MVDACISLSFRAKVASLTAGYSPRDLQNLVYSAVRRALARSLYRDESSDLLSINNAEQQRQAFRVLATDFEDAIHVIDATNTPTHQHTNTPTSSTTTTLTNTTSTQIDPCEPDKREDMQVPVIEWLDDNNIACRLGDLSMFGDLPDIGDMLPLLTPQSKCGSSINRET